MRGVIKGVLAEELRNSLRMKKEYEVALKQLLQGCLRKKNIKGHIYYYRVKRIGQKSQDTYMGKLSPEEVREYEEAKKMRAKYRKLLAQVKKQIKFLRSTLRGKEAI